MRKLNLRNHLMDSNSDMGLTLRKNALKISESPHYFEVRNSDGKRYCHCGSEEDAKYFCDTYPGFTYHKEYLPESPKTVNIPSVRLDDDLQIKAQQILPESQQQPLNL